MDLVCPECLGTLIPKGDETVRCLTHGGEFRVLFNRITSPVASAAPSSVAAAATCAQHPNLAATFVCRQCGASLCNTCAFQQSDGSAFCPDCMARRTSGASFESSSTAPPPVTSSVPTGATCLQHPNLPATQSCKLCGKFMCATCDFVLPGEIHLCPACVAAPRT